MKIAVIGSGIAGNVIAHRLHGQHDLTVYEAGDHVGGHANTVQVRMDGRSHAVDTGFIVYNERPYPLFASLLEQLGVATQPASMSFSVRSDVHGIEYNGASLNGLFAQRRNLFRPGFLRMTAGILRFYREAPSLLDAPPTITLGDFLAERRYPVEFIELHILPMAAAIWSVGEIDVLAMPVAFFVRFFVNHGFLSLRNRPVWRTITGGSGSYVDLLTTGFRSRIRTGTPVERVTRTADHVGIRARDCSGTAYEREYDRVFFACHSNQVLALLSDPSPEEREVLGAIGYQRNEVVLHTDATVLPLSRRAWASWNYHVGAADGDRAAVTYNMSILQQLPTRQPLCVSMNIGGRIDRARVIARFDYAHPVFTTAALAAQQRQAEINGARLSYYCGAYWRYGFHEDGVLSAVTALEHFRAREHAAGETGRRVAA